MMAAPPGHRQRGPRTALERAGEALEALAEAGAGVASARSIADALGALAEAVARGAGAEVTVVRVVDDERRYLVACAVASASSAVAAELEGTRVPIGEVSPDEVDELEHLPAAVGRAARRARATAVLQLPIMIGDEVDGSLELLRAGVPFDESERRVARVAAVQAALAIRAFGGNGVARGSDAGMTLSLAGDALAAGADEAQTAEQVARLAAEATGALSGLLWRAGDEQELELVSSFGLTATNTSLVDASGAAERAVGGRTPVSIEALEGPLPGGAELSASLQLGHPPVGVLQLLFPAGREPSEAELSQLATFGVRAAHALRAGARTRTMAAELERTRASLGVVGQAISQLSLAHTLETAVARVGELLDVDRLAVYLRADEQLYAAAGIGLAGPHARLAERLLELALGPFRGRGMLIVEDVRADRRLAAAGDAAAEAGIEAAVAVPLLVRDEPIGLLAVFPLHGRVLTENESALLSALAAQLAVAVQNAQLHEETKRLGEDREHALDAERASAKQLGALYEISRSFAQSLSLEATLAAVTDTITDVLDVDVALIGMPDDRREVLIPRAMRVVDERVEDAVRAIVWQPQPFGAHPVQRLFRLGEPFMLSRSALEQIGEPATRLLPFLEHGWTGGVAPIATAAEVLASLTVLSLRPDAPVTPQTLEQ
ncbi:MAG: GAF domain-containing protein, partial [Deltaproteobacteria bacterium]